MNIHPGNQYFVLNTHTSGKILWIIIFLTFITGTVFQIIYVQLYSFTTVSGSLDNHLWKCSGSEMGIIKFPLDNILEKAL